MKHLFFILILLFSELSFATNYEFKEASFTITATFEDASVSPATSTPIFHLAGTALWSEDQDGNELPAARITIRRTTYACDEVNYDYTAHFNCNLYGAKLLDILDNSVTDDANFVKTRALIQRYFDDASYYETFNIPLGTLDQPYEMEAHSELVDPENSDLSVKFTLKYSGLTPL